jgi:hypothetical protein
MERPKINFKKLAESFKIFFSNLGKVVVILTSIASGYAASEIYHKYEMSMTVQKMQTPRGGEEISAFANDEVLIIMDSKSGRYTSYTKDAAIEISNVVIRNHILNNRSDK